jgi:LCP family protein required for cell wall assembly
MSKLKHGSKNQEMPIKESKTRVFENYRREETPPQAQKKPKAKKSKKPLVITLVSLGAVLLIAAAVFVYMFFIREPDAPLKDKILNDIRSDSAVTLVKVGDTDYEFNIDKIDILKEEKADKSYKYDVSIDRSSDMYGIEASVYNVEYVRDGFDYKYKSATPKDDNLTFTALKGVDPDIAIEYVAKTYKAAKFYNQDTDLVKGIDKIRFSVDDDEYEGIAVVLYKFSDTEGWKYVKMSDKKVDFKHGVTHKEKGLYTNSNVKNILFMGVDSDSGVGRSDCMMLVSVDSNTGKIKLTSFMRDNWFEIPGHGANKLNSAYAFGGPKLTCKTISETFDILIDKYVVVDFDTFKKVINELGGVNVKITDDEAGYINWQLRKNGQTSVGLVSGGDTTLNGQQALWLCRDRGGNGFGGDDFTRSQRQRRVITSLLTTYSNYTPSKVLATIKTLKKNVKTNLTGEEFKWFAERSLRFFTYKVSERTVPQDGEWSSGFSGGGAWIIKIHDFPKLKKEIQKRIYEDIK